MLRLSKLHGERFFFPRMFTEHTCERDLHWSGPYGRLLFKLQNEVNYSIQLDFWRELRKQTQNVVQLFFTSVLLLSRMCFDVSKNIPMYQPFRYLENV